jgi:hypothetical protein
MEKKIFQSGGPIIDEDECLKTVCCSRARTSSVWRLGRRVSRGTDNLQDPPEITDLTNLQDM